MRKLIAGMKMSIDGKVEGPAGYADWVGSWADEYGLTSQIAACVLGGRMYEGYEQYWTAVKERVDLGLVSAASSGDVDSGGSAEEAWARFASVTPHYVVSRTRVSATWPTVTFLRSLDAIADLKREPGKDIYLMGGAELTTLCIEAGLLDELRIIIYPLIAGAGTPLFTRPERYGLELRQIDRLSEGRVALNYALTTSAPASVDA